jgi:hypothetical protein
MVTFELEYAFEHEYATLNFSHFGTQVSFRIKVKDLVQKNIKTQKLHFAHHKYKLINLMNSIPGDA